MAFKVRWDLSIFPIVFRKGRGGSVMLDAELTKVLS